MSRSERRLRNRPGLQPWHWFILAAATPIIHCANRLDLDLWHDEIYTIDVFVRRGPAFIVSDYSLPNNHVLFSLLMWPFYRLSDSDFVLRLPSFLLAIGTLALLFRLGRRWCGLPCAVLATALLGLNQMYLNFAIQVRGYGLSMFLAVCLASLAAPQSTVFSWKRFVAILLFGAAFLYVVPTNLLFFVPLTSIAVAISAVRDWTLRSVLRESAAWAAAALLALACYLPILGQMREMARTASPSTLGYVPVIAGNFFRPATHDFAWFAPLFLLGLIAWAWPRPAGQRRQWAIPLITGGVVAGAFLLTGILRLSPFERNYCPLLPLVGLAGGWLLAELIESVRGRLPRSVSVEAATGLALAAVCLAIWPHLWTFPRRLEARRDEVNATEKWPIADGYYCYYAANYRPSSIVDFLLEQRIQQSAYRVCVAEVDHLNVWYYFARAGLPLLNASADEPPGQTPRLFAIVPEPPPWKMLAADCGLPAERLGAFRLVGDFGYYRLYQLELSFNDY